MQIPKGDFDCLTCKGRLHCGLSYCPILIKAKAYSKVTETIQEKDFSGNAPSVFVGRVGYPNVNVGILSTQAEKSEEYDAPKMWAKQNLDIPSIIHFRSSLINSTFSANVRLRNTFLEKSQEIGLASKPTGVEMELKDKPYFRIQYAPSNPPMGPNAILKQVRLTENPKIPTKVEKVYSDTDWKAKDALTYLHKNEFDENYLSRILSIGTVGIKKQRKLVPTRWSITAVDDTIGKETIEEIKTYPHADYQVFFGGYLGNYFLILFFSDAWSYELFEMYAPNVSWNITNTLRYTTDYESYSGRKEYAEQCAGGYYAARIAISEKLAQMKKQASVLCLRFITDDYSVPLGVWVVREAVRKALSTKPLEMDCKENVLQYAKEFSKKKFGMDISEILKKSILATELRSQIKLTNFFMK